MLSKAAVPSGACSHRQGGVGEAVCKHSPPLEAHLGFYAVKGGSLKPRTHSTSLNRTLDLFRKKNQTYEPNILKEEYVKSN